MNLAAEVFPRLFSIIYKIYIMIIYKIYIIQFAGMLAITVTAMNIWLATVG